MYHFSAFFVAGLVFCLSFCDRQRNFESRTSSIKSNKGTILKKNFNTVWKSSSVIIRYLFGNSGPSKLGNLLKLCPGSCSIQ